MKQTAQLLNLPKPIRSTGAPTRRFNFTESEKKSTPNDAINNIPGFWPKNGEVAKDLYVAFTAKSADAVRASYKAAIDAGATSIKEPSLRAEWRAGYFAANVGEADGYNVQIAYKPWLYK